MRCVLLRVIQAYLLYLHLLSPVPEREQSLSKNNATELDSNFDSKTDREITRTLFALNTDLGFDFIIPPFHSISERWTEITLSVRLNQSQIRYDHQLAQLKLLFPPDQLAHGEEIAENAMLPSS